MSRPFLALLALPVLAMALSGPASAAEPTGPGLSIGGAFVGPVTGLLPNVQVNSSLDYRFEPWGAYSEARVSLLSRAQSLSAAHDYVFETSGLNLALGGKVSFLHAGVGLEAAVLKQIRIDPAAPSQLVFHNGAGILVEPYVGVTLPFLNTPVSELELDLKVPIAPINLLDASIGPRLTLTLWLGAPGGDDEADDDDDEATGTDEDEDEDDHAGDSDEEEAPEAPPITPAPTPKPQPKPSAKPAPVHKR